MKSLNFSSVVREDWIVTVVTGVGCGAWWDDPAAAVLSWVVRVGVLPCWPGATRVPVAVVWGVVLAPALAGGVSDG